MKIAVFTPYNIFKPGGVDEHVQYQAEILRKRGHEVTVITPKPRTPAATKAPKGTVFLGTSARIKAPHATHSDISMTVDNEAIDELIDEKFDIIHVHEPLSPIVARQLLVRAAESNTVRVGTLHAALPGNRLGKSLITTFKGYARSVMPYVDVVTAVSPAAIGYIERYTDQPINYIPNGINSDFYKKQDRERNKNQILFIGRLEKRKGARQAIKAFAVLKESMPKAKLTIAGDGPLRKSLEQYVEDQGIDDVEFLGFVSDKKKLQLLSTCGVYTSPALYGESFGIVLAEAMAMGAPIVCHKNDGYSWVMQGTGRLSLVDCKDPEVYAERLQLLLEDDDLREVWQKWAYNHVQQFDYEKVVDSYEALYDEAIRKSKS